ncbi:MAG: hypothetical protein LBE91_00695 [Tannerella sp.]|nr:hypothetical protein [Tannerella sp.]
MEQSGKKALKELGEEGVEKAAKELGEEGADKLPKVITNGKVSYDDLGKIEPCFLPGTLISTVLGLKPIEFVNKQDRIIVFDYKNYNYAVKNVVNVFKNWAEAYFIVKTDLGDSIKATGRHMFWIENEQRWKIAKKLNVGDILKTRNGYISITDVLRIDNINTDTFNLEIADCHNYLVGVNGILVHNQSKTSKFESQVASDVEFYKVVDSKGNTVYVGQTTQGVDERFKQHIHEGQTKPGSFKSEWGDPSKYSVEPIDIPKKGPLTPYEAHVWEKHLIEKERLNGQPIKNKANPIGNKKFDQYGHLHNPC